MNLITDERHYTIVFVGLMEIEVAIMTNNERHCFLSPKRALLSNNVNRKGKKL